MGAMWTVARLEARLLFRGRGIWIAATILAALGGWMGTMIREQPWGAWAELSFTAILSTLVLTLSTGNAVQRDDDLRVGDTLLSTPVPTVAYVVGKYLTAVGVLLGLSLVEVTAGILSDHFDEWRDPPLILGHSHYPALGPLPFVASWAWLMVTPIVFGGALTLAALTLSRGQRVLAYASVVALWLLPGFLSYNVTFWPDLLDVTGSRILNDLPLKGSTAAFYLSSGPTTPQIREQIMQLVRSDLPPAMPATFVWGRVLFLTLALVLVCVTIRGVARRRRGRPLVA